MMPLVGSLLMGAFAVFILRTLVLAVRSGVIFSDGVAYDARKQPGTFASTAAIHSGGAVLFAWLALSGHVAGLWPVVGLH
jgi:hypothetical protein